MCNFLKSGCKITHFLPFYKIKSTKSTSFMHTGADFVQYRSCSLSSELAVHQEVEGTYQFA